jgi:hypothetical protein
VFGVVTLPDKEIRAVKHKILTWVAIAFVVFMVWKNPAGAATTAQHLGSTLADVASAFGDFFTHLTGGGGR